MEFNYKQLEESLVTVEDKITNLEYKIDGTKTLIEEAEQKQIVNISEQKQNPSVQNGIKVNRQDKQIEKLNEHLNYLELKLTDAKNEKTNIESKMIQCSGEESHTK